ncbi:LysR family transcriptional regulator [Pseudonocardia oroxyli]|uniref:DNA-binding transcriptional regulator, LysR family n=1 Tax=Pseudonocardia oroxyli TaxID=366584 RepID=A0A1G7VCX9_PSEOR|nr:LysR family transcriptional regulator [Pseudonocardia oroxyli]SDG57666.1 DNA-binding transcriptional regulator, LysR family [Pseudonocardia oroxyli]
MKLSSLDLNLLVALDALLQEANVTRAGRRLDLSQSAMSGALARLRKLFGDPLLVRTGNDLRLTPLAVRLRGEVAELLVGVRGLFEVGPGEPGRRVFTVAGSDYTMLVLLPSLLERLRRRAPEVRIDARPLSRTAAALVDEGIDVIVQPRELEHVTMPSRDLFVDRWLCAVWADHPTVGDRLTLAEFRGLPQVVYSLGRAGPSIADAHLARMAPDRTVAASVESFLMVPVLLEGTSAVSLLLERGAWATRVGPAVRLLAPPVPLPDIHQAMYWDARFDADPGHTFLREQISEVAAEVAAPVRAAG